VHFGSHFENFARPSPPGEGLADAWAGYVNSRTKLVTAFAPVSENLVKARKELPLITVSATVFSGFA
jgi:hypothetical protein